ncbi:hypothetical protein O6H91_15G000700 [Diphasiastrum complanatum]|uniref:Uncharacterized protein n=1 Tax=Diphasiastrum complanatum TaxID=34168 RepID=A0ACC2BG14_DIPCM|nr:hypothetical protein O6H91_15G000700 [Diphasiastrum complanatum]
MAVNPQLFPNGLPMPFEGELFVLTREGVECQADKIPDIPGGSFSAKGKLYFSNVHLIFVVDKPIGNLFVVDMPLLFIHEERFNQPIFLCNNVLGKVHPVIPDGSNRSYDLCVKVTCHDPQHPYWIFFQLPS